MDLFSSSYEVLPGGSGPYLARLGVEPPAGAPTREYLDRLVLRHQCAVPFENLDIFDGGSPVSTDLSAVWRKVVEQRRGGYCFELNALFCALLRALGYDAYPCACRIQRGAAELRPVLHRACLVRWEGELLFCDVGYGGAMYPGALPLVPGVPFRKEDVTFHWEEGDGLWWKLMYHSRGLAGPDGVRAPSTVRLEMLVSTAPQAPVDFDLANTYCCSHPDSFFVNHRTVYLRRAGGQIALLDREFSRVEDGRRVSRTLPDDRAVRRVLREEFGLDLPGT